MKRLYLLASVACITSLPTFAGSITASAGFTNTTANPAAYGFAFASPYIDGPIGSVAQSIGIVGMDRTGDGFALTNVSLATEINGNTVHTTNIGDCTLGPGGAGSTVGCSPAGDQWAASSQAIAEPSTGGEPFTAGLKVNVSGGDMFMAVYYATLLGLNNSGAPMSTSLSGAIIVQNFTSNPNLYQFVFSAPSTAGRYTQANLNFAGSVLDVGGDGATAEIDVSMSLGAVLLSLGIQDTCSVNNGLLAGTLCRGGTGFGPLISAANGPNSGLITVLFNAILSGNGDSAAFQTATMWSESEPVPEPATGALLLGGLGLLALARRGRRR